MKSDEIFYIRIVSELKAELSNIKRLRDEYQQFLDKYKIFDEFLIRVKASFMADFYMAVERVFQIIANEIDGGAPKGEDWHKRLLWSMTIEMEGIRAPVISSDLYKSLQPFLGFRHVVRQAYGFQLDETKLNELVSTFVDTLDSFIAEIEQFCEKLRESGKE